MGTTGPACAWPLRIRRCCLLQLAQLCSPPVLVPRAGSAVLRRSRCTGRLPGWRHWWVCDAAGTACRMRDVRQPLLDMQGGDMRTGKRRWHACAAMCLHEGSCMSWSLNQTEVAPVVLESFSCWLHHAAGTRHQPACGVAGCGRCSDSIACCCQLLQVGYLYLTDTERLDAVMALLQPRL